jgi:hypothetical protein
MRSLSTLIAGGFFALLSACSTSPQYTEWQEVPPRSLVTGNVDTDGRVILVWDRPAAFEKISGERKALGDAACLMSRADLEAIGYHPRAKDIDGKDMQGGGYLCAPKAHGDRPGAVPPMLVRRNNIVGWDAPGAFGAVPSTEEARGDAVCGRALLMPVLKAYGYHPDARDESGRTILGGGFFCGPMRSGRAGPS